MLQACDSDNDTVEDLRAIQPEPEAMTIVDVAAANGSFTTLVAALQATGLDDTLDNPDASFTVFAPTDDAFALLGTDTINALLDDTETLSDILTYHVISGSVDSGAAVAAAGGTVEMVNGDMIGLSLSDGSLLVNTATVTTTDIMTDNGIIHVIDAVLLPPEDKGMPDMNIAETAIAAGNFTTLVAALQATDLVDTVSDETMMYTVFAPTDEAFAALGTQTITTLLNNPDVLKDILLQHVVVGEANSVAAYTLNGTDVGTASSALVGISIDPATDMLMFGNANITMKDIYTNNGVIHVLDAVVVGDVMVPDATIYDVAEANGSFTTLVAALDATGLDAAVSNPEAELTVFAPTDDAFALLGEDTITALLADTDTLSNILQYHVIASEVDAEAAVGSAGMTVEMLNGDNIGLSLDGENLLVNTATVTATDIMTANGIIHVIDAVLMPPAEMTTPTMNVVDTAIADGRFTTLVTAVTTAGLAGALSDADATLTVFAPTDDAFALLGNDTINTLLANPTVLAEILQQHVLSSQVSATTAYTLNGGQATTLSGAMIDISIDSTTDMLQFGGANIIIKDIYTTNGVIHVLDAVVVGDVMVP